MSNNLIPPFIMRECGITVNDVPKIHVRIPDESHHAITFEETGFRIPLNIWGVFSYFVTQKPTVDDYNSIEEVYLLTPSRWNPNTDVYARNEESMLDWNGDMIPYQQRTRILLNDIGDNNKMISSLQISSVESEIIDSNIELNNEQEQPDDNNRGDISTLLKQISPLLCPVTMYSRMQSRASIGKYYASIGSTTALDSKYLVEDVEENIEVNEEDDKSSEASSNSSETSTASNDSDFWNSLAEDESLDEIFVSSTFGKKKHGIDAEHLSKIWRIDLETAKRTLEVTTQSKQHVPNPKLAKNYTTNDRMLRYKRINEKFFMDTFFATKKAGKSTRGHTCCQLFVTDKGFLYVVPMKSKSEVILALKQFSKEIGAPDAIIADSANEQKSQDIKRFLG
jgi:hypothetical protein